MQSTDLSRFIRIGLFCAVFSSFHFLQFYYYSRMLLRENKIRNKKLLMIAIVLGYSAIIFVQINFLLTDNKSSSSKYFHSASIRNQISPVRKSFDNQPIEYCDLEISQLTDKTQLSFDTKSDWINLPAKSKQKSVAKTFSAEPANPLDDRILHRRLRKLFYAIAQVESNNNRLAVGDKGRSRGLYQISRAYWKDACRLSKCRWNYYDRVWNKYSSERVMIWYWKRFCKNALIEMDYETLARIHNGGPRGDRKRSTYRYWNRVKNILESQRD